MFSGVLLSVFSMQGTTHYNFEFIINLQSGWAGHPYRLPSILLGSAKKSFRIHRMTQASETIAA